MNLDLYDVIILDIMLRMQKLIEIVHTYESHLCY